MPQRIIKMQAEIGAEVAKAAPPATVVVAGAASGWDLNSAVLWATLIYIGLQAAYLLWKWRRDIQRERDGVEA